MSEPRIVSQQDGLYKYVVYEDMEQRWWKIHRPGDETPDYYDELDGDLIADLLSWLHTQRDKAEAENAALRAEVERLGREKFQLLDVLRELLDFSERSPKYKDRSHRAFVAAIDILEKLECEE